MKPIALLLATYNGEKYLRAQLQSLSDQTNQDWILYVRDDCSTDKTLEIINEFQIKHLEKIHLLPNDNVNLGAKRSFIELLKYAEADYYMFVDQDDVWLPTKIETSLRHLKLVEIKNPTKGILTFCDAVVTDEELTMISPSFWKTTRTNPHQLKSGKKFEVFNCAPGCTMLFNHRLKSALFPFPERAPMHDWWVAIVAQRIGIVHPFDEALILYRQHSSNAIGAEKINKSYFISKFYSLRNVIKAQNQHLAFLQEIKGVGKLEFYFIKLTYSIRRFF